MPFRTLRVLLRSRASRPAFPRWSIGDDNRNYRTALRVACLYGRSASFLRRRASRPAFPRWSVRNDNLNYRAALRVACLSGRSASSCDAERRDLRSHAGACGTIISTIVRRSASHAFPDAARPHCDAERRDLHSHARACGTIISTIMRRSASHAFPDAARPHCDAERRDLHSHAGAWERESNYRAALRVACLSGRCASSLRRRASRPAFPRWSVRNDNRNYRAALRVACLSGRSGSSCDAERRDLRSHAGACGTIISTIVRRSASHAFPDAARPLTTQSVETCIPTLERRGR